MTDTPAKRETRNSPDDIASAIISTALRLVVATPALAFLWALLTAR